MPVCAQKHDLKKGQMTHPTNPEVAACRAPVFGLRFVVGVLKVYREHLATVFRYFQSLFLGQALEGALQHVSVRLVSLDFWKGRSHITRKFKWLQRESAHASGTIRKPSTRST